MDKISVIVPVYNVEKYLTRCVDSLLGQTHKELEIILVDDGSKDGSSKICDNFKAQDNRVIVVHKENGGVSSARNVGIELATGKFISFVDGDDWVDKTYFEKLIGAQKKNDADLTFCRYAEKFDDKEIVVIEKSLEKFCETCDIQYFYNYEASAETENIKVNNTNIMGSTCRILYKKDIIKDCHFLPTVKLEEDLLFLTEILAQNKNLKLNFVDEALYFYYQRENSATKVFKDFIIESYLNFVKHLEELNVGENIIACKKYHCYTALFISSIRYNIAIPREIESWNTKENYLITKKNTSGLSRKLKLFCARHKLKFIVKLLYKIKKEIK